ncbi:MAG: type III polyketide synthase [Verrucomicrobiota bacterium]
MSWIHHIESLAPDSAYSQESIAGWMKSWTEGHRAKRYIDTVYASSGIQKRHLVLDDMQESGVPSFSFYRENGSMREPTTRARNQLFIEKSKPIIEEVAKRALERCEAIEKEQITHVITVSCTGFYNPGPDLVVVNALGLSERVERYHLGFMGCYASFPALRMADQFCQADPEATVLIVCVEFCSLHLQINDDLDSVLANSVFADGAAAVLINGRPPTPGRVALEMESFASGLAREGEEDMAWEIGDRGFNLMLSKYVSKIIGAGIGGIIDSVLSEVNLTHTDIKTWAVHPGGKAILDQVEEGLDLNTEQLSASREVLRDFGNMSCVTILFILKQLLYESEYVENELIGAIAFGPGLTIESAFLKRTKGQSD